MNKIICSFIIIYFTFFNTIIYAKDKTLIESNTYLNQTMNYLIENNLIDIVSLKNIITNISQENIIYLSIICREFAVLRSRKTCPKYLEFIVSSPDANKAIEHTLPILKSNFKTLDNSI